MSPVLAFILYAGFTTPNGSVVPIIVSGLANESECHRVALDMFVSKHKCIEYMMAVPQIDVDDAVQDALQDGDAT
jgi:hypothetical protein